MKSVPLATSKVMAHVSAAGDARRKGTLELTLEAPSFPGALVLHCQGDVMFRSDARSLSSVITDVLPTARRMVVDLAGVSCLDSDALGELVLTQLWADSSNHELRFACPNGSLRRLLENTNLAQVLDLYASVPAAMMATSGEDLRAS